MKKNVKVVAPVKRTHGGAVAKNISNMSELRRTILSCLLWEDNFYESGESIADRIKGLIPRCPADLVAELAIEARSKMNLRHVPLIVCRELARAGALDSWVLEQVIQRPDELAEFLSLYWSEGKTPIAKQVKIGLGNALKKFNEYSLAKYNQDGAIKLRDVMFMTHPKPNDKAQAELWKRLANNELETPETWEVLLSAGNDKKAVWTKLLSEGKLGALALLRNLRNMQQAAVNPALIKIALQGMDTTRVLPFRFLAAAAEAPAFEEEIDGAFLRACDSQTKLTGHTLIVVDVSGSMQAPMSGKSRMDRLSAACALAALARESCEKATVYATAGSDYTRIHQTALVPARRGIALTDAIKQAAGKLGGGGIFLTPVLRYLKTQHPTGVNRIIVVTDEQDCAVADKDKPTLAEPFGQNNYMINVGSNKNGIGYGKWLHIDGFSSATVQYIQEIEKRVDLFADLYGTAVQVTTPR